jgi:hypothetical protein
MQQPSEPSATSEEELVAAMGKKLNVSDESNTQDLNVQEAM